MAVYYVLKQLSSNSHAFAINKTIPRTATTELDEPREENSEFFGDDRNPIRNILMLKMFNTDSPLLQLTTIVRLHLATFGTRGNIPNQTHINSDEQLGAVLPRASQSMNSQQRDYHDIIPRKNHQSLLYGRRTGFWQSSFFDSDSIPFTAGIPINL